MAPTEHVGIDFGTTNSALAVVRAGEEPRLVTYDRQGRASQTGRSVLFFDPDRRDVAGRPDPFAGPDAIDAYLSAAEEGSTGRLLQSLKSHLASRSFTKTSVFGTPFDLSDLIGFIAKRLVMLARAQLGLRATRAVVGRPVRFVAAADPADELLALTRLRAAFACAGFDDVFFELEPVAASHFYDRSLDHDELVLIADFGGGTSDFSLVRVGPASRGVPSEQRVLGNAGVPLAGDAFDRAIVNHVVAPRLGKGTTYRPPMSENRLPVPGWVFQRLGAWHHLSFLKTPDALRSLREVHRGSDHPERIASLIHLIEADLGHALYAAVERVKSALSVSERVPFAFVDPPIGIHLEISRAEFEEWIRPDVSKIDAAVTGLLTQTGANPADVDAVFMTGGTAFVPAVRRLFAQRFGEARLRGGNELTSVALGLALRAQELGH